MYRVIKIGTDGSSEGRTQEKAPTLEELQKAVGGYIELIPGFHRYFSSNCRAYFNENGRLLNLPPNGAATALWKINTSSAEVIAGDIVIVIKISKVKEASKKPAQ